MVLIWLTCWFERWLMCQSISIVVVVLVFVSLDWVCSVFFCRNYANTSAMVEIGMVMRYIVCIVDVMVCCMVVCSVVFSVAISRGFLSSFFRLRLVRWFLDILVSSLEWMWVDSMVFSVVMLKVWLSVWKNVLVEVVMFRLV